MATTQVALTYGGKELDCELSFTPPYKSFTGQNCEFTLEKVSLVCKLQLNFDGKKLMEVTHLEDITSLIINENMWEDIEELSITAISERGYV